MKQYPKQYGLYASYGGPGPIGLAMQFLSDAALFYERFFVPKKRKGKEKL